MSNTEKGKDNWAIKNLHNVHLVTFQLVKHYVFGCEMGGVFSVSGTYKFIKHVGNREGKRLLEDPEINARISLKCILEKMGQWSVDYIRLGLDIQWYTALENTIMNVTVPQKAGPKTSYVTISFSRATLFQNLHGCTVHQ
jgi:hypothetical protein